MHYYLYNMFNYVMSDLDYPIRIKKLIHVYNDPSVCDPAIIPQGMIRHWLLTHPLLMNMYSSIFAMDCNVTVSVAACEIQETETMMIAKEFDYKIDRVYSDNPIHDPYVVFPEGQITIMLDGVIMGVHGIQIPKVEHVLLRSEYKPVLFENTYKEVWER